MLTRRQFIGTTAGAALAEKLFAAPKESKTPNPELEKLADNALREAKKYKASYCDIRIVRLRDQFVSMRVSTDRGTSSGSLSWGVTQRSR